MMEIRHVAGAPLRREGAVTAPSGGFIYHAVGALGRSTRDEIDAGFARARDVWASADTGVTPGSWIEGAPSVPSALCRVLTTGRPPSEASVATYGAWPVPAAFLRRRGSADRGGV
jgi:hypothetical protein